MKLLRTIVHRSGQTAANVLKIVNTVISLNNVSPPYNEETRL
jgi:hypothetical protein